MRIVRDAWRAAKASYAMSHERSGIVVPRMVREGTIPLIEIEGEARDCGRQYAERVKHDYPGYERYLVASEWCQMSQSLKRCFEKEAPFLFDLHQGICDVVASSQAGAGLTHYSAEDCTCFSVSPSLTLDGQPLSGQNKDTGIESANTYVVLKMAIKGGPKILVLAYPGEVLGYGMWSTGMTVFRSSLHSRTSSADGVDMSNFGLLALASTRVESVEEIARRFGIRGKGNLLVSDKHGRTLSIEYNGSGMSVIQPTDGVLTHANHPVGVETAGDEYYPNEAERQNSRYRMEELWRLLNVERGRLTAQKAYMALSDHSKYPLGICRHVINGTVTGCTTTTILAEPAKGLLHVTRGNPCSNWPSTFTF